VGLYFPDSKALFIHISRTGGRWIRFAARTSGIKCKRDSYRRTRSSFEEQEFNLTDRHHTLPLQYSWMPEINFMFAFVRHPIAYYESVWKGINLMPIGLWKRNRAKHFFKTRWHPNKICMDVTDGMKTPDFDIWVERLLTEHGNWVTRYFEVVAGPQWGEWCQFVGRTETLEEDFENVMNILGYGRKIKKHEDKWKGVREIGASTPRYFERPEVPLKIVWRQDLKQQVEYEERIGIQRWYGKETANRRIYGKLFKEKEKSLYHHKEET